MPNHKSAEKRMRQSERRRKLNRGNRSRLRTSLKNLRSALEGDGKQASEILPETISTIDRAVQKGVLHKNAAARYKSRLTARVNAAAIFARLLVLLLLYPPITIIKSGFSFSIWRTASCRSCVALQIVSNE